MNKEIEIVQNKFQTKRNKNRLNNLHIRLDNIERNRESNNIANLQNKHISILQNSVNNFKNSSFAYKNEVLTDVQAEKIFVHGLRYKNEYELAMENSANYRQLASDKKLDKKSQDIAIYGYLMYAKQVLLYKNRRNLMTLKNEMDPKNPAYLDKYNKIMKNNVNIADIDIRLAKYDKK